MPTISINSTTEFRDLPELADFLTALRHAGISVGVLEMARLRQLLATAPALRDPTELHRMLGFLLVKDDAQQAIFDRIFANWEACWPVLAEPTLPDESTGESPGFDEADKPMPPRPVDHEKSPSPMEANTPETLPEPVVDRRVWRGGLLMGGVVGLGGIAGLLLGDSTATPAWLILLTGAVVLDGLLGWRLWAQLRKPESLKSVRPGPAWLTYLPSHGGSGLLEQGERREMVWSVDRYVSEDLTTRLDLGATVARTAAEGGIFTPCYELAAYPRAVWLWMDGYTSTPLGRQLVREITQSLGRAGLPVRQGMFTGYPIRVRWVDGEDFSPLVMEGFRQQAIVMILTDGQGLANASRSGRTHRQLGLLLEGLSGWRQLAFVDLSVGTHGLGTLLAQHGIPCLMPWQTAAFIAGRRGHTRHPVISLRLSDHLMVWAGALALSPGPVELEIAQRLRDHLKLDLAPWQLEVLIQQGRMAAGRIVLPARKRMRWLRELVFAERGNSGVPPESFLHKAVEFWLTWLNSQETQQHNRSSKLQPWRRTLAERELLLKRALLTWWINPESGTEKLFQLWKSDPTTVTREVANYLPWDRFGTVEDDAEVFLLPWCEREQPARVREMLAKMGFGSAVQAQVDGHIAIPGRWWTMLGLSGGMAIAAGLGIGGGLGYGLALAVAGGLFWVFRQHGKQRVEDRPTNLPAGIQTEIEQPEPDPEPIPPLDEPLVMLELDGGTFLMGSPESDDQADGDERPQHEVSLSPFAMSRELVTWELYREVMESSPERWQRDKSDDRLPANSVTWFNAVEFCNRLSDRVGLTPCYRIDGREVTWNREADGYRLPTEAEWEYACRARTTTRWFFGDEPDELGEYAWYEENSKDRVHPVGEKRPNPWGLHDMTGNIWEWCWDWFGEYSKDSQTDPDGPPTGDRRVLRGGAFHREPWNLRSACRNWFVPGSRLVYFGFRVVRGSRRQP